MSPINSQQIDPVNREYKPFDRGDVVLWQKAGRFGVAVVERCYQCCAKIRDGAVVRFAPVETLTLLSSVWE